MTIREMIKKIVESGEFEGSDRFKLKELYPVFFDGKIDGYFPFGQYTYFIKAKELISDNESAINLDMLVDGYKIKKASKKEQEDSQYKYTKYVEYYLSDQNPSLET